MVLFPNRSWIFRLQGGNDMTTQNEPQAGTQSRWQFDPFHTQVEFATKHLGMMTVRGHFSAISSTGNIHPDKPEASSVELTMQTASIRTHNEPRDNDLRSPNFLEDDKYQPSTFKTTKTPPTPKYPSPLTPHLTTTATTPP